MALCDKSLKERIVSNLKAAGFKAGKHSQFEVLSQAIASAVVQEIQSNSEVSVTGGSSSGIYKVK